MKLMKICMLLLLLVPVISVLKFVLLDILDDLVAKEKRQRKTKTVRPSASKETYGYRKAQ